MKENTGIGRETLGKFFYDLAKIVLFFYDLAKIVFTGLVVGGAFSLVTEQNVRGYIILMGIGAIISCGFVFVGYKILKS